MTDRFERLNAVTFFRGQSDRGVKKGAPRWNYMQIGAGLQQPKGSAGAGGMDIENSLNEVRGGWPAFRSPRTRCRLPSKVRRAGSEPLATAPSENRRGHAEPGT